MQPPYASPNPPPGSPEYYSALHAQLLQQQLTAQIEVLKVESRQLMGAEIMALREQLQADVKRRTIWVLAPVLAVVVAAVALLALGQAQALNKTFIDFQNSVMGLQKEVVASERLIASSTKELAIKDSQIAAANIEVATARARLDKAALEFDADLREMRARLKSP